MIGEKSKVANAVGGRTARACDSCLRRRASWFCAADDAFLCQSCDTTVHGANQLASRHERVRLQTSSFKGSDNECSPAWHRGFTRKPRTPRRQRQAKDNNDGVDFVDPPLPFVPEMSSEDDQSPVNDDKEQLLFQVPVFDKKLEKTEFGELGKESSYEGYDHDEFDHQIQGFLESELELAEFAADVESLLGVSTIEDDQSCQLDDLLGFKEEEEDDDFNIDIGIGVDVDLAPSVVKVEEDNIDQPRLGFQVNPNFSTKDEGKLESDSSAETTNKRDILLTLNYEAVIDAWDSQGSPWMTGIRPIVKPEHGWPECLDDIQNQNRDCGFGHVGSGQSDAGRQARVLRYREKRRTRLFSKKIRYQVRKLNAEKRPRMKGRFVKRTSFMGPYNNVPTFIASTTTFPYQYHYINQ